MNKFQEQALITLLAPAPQNGQTHSNNLSGVAVEFFEPFCGVKV